MSSSELPRRGSDSDRHATASVKSLTAFAVTATTLVSLGLANGYDPVVRGAVAVVVWWGLALIILLDAVPLRRPSTPGLVSMAALASLGIWTTASLGWTTSADRAVLEACRVFAHLGVLAIVILLAGPATWRAVIGGCTVAGVALALLALGSRLGWPLVGTDVAADSFGTKRLSYPFGYWNAVGAWAGMTAAMCLAWSAHAPRVGVRSACLAAVPVTITVAYLTYSRAALGGTVVGLLVLCILSRNRWLVAGHAAIAAVGGAVAITAVRSHQQIADGTGTTGAGTFTWQIASIGVVVGLAAAATGMAGLDRLRLPVRGGRIATGLLAVFALVSVVVAGERYGSELWDQFTTPVSAAAFSNDPAARLGNLSGTRYEIWSTALSSAPDHLWKGSGAGTFEFTWNVAAKSPEFVRDAHSLYLETLSELGVPGLLSVVLLLVASAMAVVTAVRLAGDSAVDRGAVAAAGAALTAYFFGAGLDWLWESTSVAILALVLLGATAAASSRSMLHLPLPWRIAIGLIAIALAIGQLPTLISTSKVRESQSSVRAGDLQAAWLAANDAVRTAPWSAAAFAQRALVAERRGDPSASVANVRRAASLDPLDWRYELLLARTEARAGNASAAVAAYRRARALRPRAEYFRVTAPDAKGVR